MLANPLLVAIVAIVAVVALIILNWDKLKPYFEALLSVIKEYFNTAWNAIKAVAGVVAGVFMSVWGPVKSFFSDLWDMVKKGAQIAFGLTGVGMIITVGKLVVQNWRGVFDFFKSIWKNISFDVYNLVGGAFARLSSIGVSIKNVWAQVAGFFGIVFRDIGNAAVLVGNKILNVFKAIPDFIARMFAGIANNSIVKTGLNILAKVTGHADGGLVNKQQPYIVGERGPELFVPQGAGKIIPNYQMNGLNTQSSATPSYNITINNPIAEPGSLSLPRAIRRSQYLRGANQ